MVNAPMPINMSINAFTFDSEGKPFVEGRIYSWNNGAQQARFHNGSWEPVKVPNDACKTN
jgi:hypothetical protein